MYKHITSLILIFFLLQSTSYAESSTLNKAMAAHQANNFKQAASLLLNEHRQLESFTKNEKWDVATIFFDNSNVYREIHKSALQAQIAYLNTLKIDSSVYTQLYLASAYYQLGDFSNSKKIFDKIDASAITDDTETIHYQILAELTRSHTEIVKNNFFSEPTLKNKLAKSYINIEKNNENYFPNITFNDTELENIAQRENLPAHSKDHLIRILIDRNRLDLAAKLVITLDSNKPTFTEYRRATKQIRYYSLSLTHTLAMFYAQMSKHSNILHNQEKLKSVQLNSVISQISLAEKKRLNKNYSASLQILFSVAKNYPIVRQIQDAVQGEYLFEQRSSGIPTVF